MDGVLENTWLMDSGCLRHMTGNKKWFSNLTPLSHKEYVTFGDDKKGEVLGTDVIKVNACFTLKAIHSDNETEFRNAFLINFVLSMVLISSFLPRIFLNRMES
jgi:hypothetical protein